MYNLLNPNISNVKSEMNNYSTAPPPPPLACNNNASEGISNCLSSIKGIAARRLTCNYARRRQLLMLMLLPFFTMLAPGRSEAQDSPTAFLSLTSRGDLPEGAVRTLTLGLRNVSNTTPATTFTLTLSGDAVRGSDYTLSCNTAAGVTCNLSGDTPSITVNPSQLVSVRAVDFLLNVTAIADDTKEEPETVTLSLGSRRPPSFKIVDAPNKTTVRFNRAMVIGREGGGINENPNVPMIVDPPFGSDIDINFMVSGTATAGVDYTAIAMPVTIPAGTNAFGEFIITLIDDALVEGDETIILTLYDLPDSVSAGDPSTVTITIVDDEDPSGISITSDAAASVAENTTQVLDVTAANTAGTVTTYSTGGGADRNLFNLNRTSGALTFKTAPNFEMPTDQGGDNVYEVFVVARDGVGRADFQTITVTVIDVNEPPVIAAQTFSVTENSTAGTVVGTVAATDEDAGDNLTFAITSGNVNNAFAINARSGEITAAGTIDHETTPTYNLTVQVSDGDLSATAAVTINVTNVNDNDPMITSPATASVAENTITVLTVMANDADAGTTLTYSITAGADSVQFSIDQSSGALTFKMAPDFESASANGNDDYEVIVRVSDGTNTDMQIITVTVTDVNEAPTIAPQTFSVTENTTAGTTVGTVAATDEDAGSNLTFSITSGNIGNSFAINASSGAITVAGALDHETTPTYILTVQVSDGDLSANATVTVNVTNVNEPPMITSSATASVVEGTTIVLTVTATDADAGTILNYSITAGIDSVRFSIGQSNGDLTFKTAPDFEAPGSADNDNVYEVIVTASDGTNSDTQTITVTVTNDPADDVLGLSADEEEAVIFPNPSGDYLEVRSALGGTFRILSLSGKSLLEGITNTKVDITSLPSGLYLVQLPDGRLLKFVRE